MITAQLEGYESVILRYKSLPEKMRQYLLRSTKRVAIDLQSFVKSSKLSGQVLNVKTGTLRRSITERVTDSATAVTGIVGTNVAYARLHEYGFRGTEQVKEYMRATASGKTCIVSAHSSQVNFPERSFLRSALREKTGEIKQQLTQAVMDAAHGNP